LFDKLSDYQFFKEYPAPWSNEPSGSIKDGTLLHGVSVFLLAYFPSFAGEDRLEVLRCL
jgi:hypothetical protein